VDHTPRNSVKEFLNCGCKTPFCVYRALSYVSRAIMGLTD
jgi:hypothetical protein